MFKLDAQRKVVYRATNTKTSGAFRVETYKLYEDDGGLYILKRRQKVYLTPENCTNLFDILDSVKYN